MHACGVIIFSDYLTQEYSESHLLAIYIIAVTKNIYIYAPLLSHSFQMTLYETSLAAEAEFDTHMNLQNDYVVYLSPM